MKKTAFKAKGAEHTVSESLRSVSIILQQAPYYHQGVGPVHPWSETGPSAAG